MNNTKHRPILNYGAGKIMVTMSGFLYTWYWFINPYNVFPLSVFIDIFAYILLVQSFTHRHSISHLFALSPSSLCFSSFCLSIFLYRLIGLLLSIYLFSLSSVWFRLFILIFTLSLRLFNVYSLELPTCLCLFLGFTPLPSLSLCVSVKWSRAFFYGLWGSGYASPFINPTYWFRIGVRLSCSHSWFIDYFVWLLRLLNLLIEQKAWANVRVASWGVEFP